MSRGIISSTLVGIDLGGTNVRAGLVVDGKLAEFQAAGIDASGTVDEVLEQIYGVVDALDLRGADSIGIGVPSVVDTREGVVYDVQNIPSWKKVEVRSILQERYRLPVFVNNDANCFVLGEKYFGKAKGYDSVVGLILGTGFAAGLLLDGSLYEGSNCGAGEFGMIAYLDGNYEAYCSGQFFLHRHAKSGSVLYEEALAGDEVAKGIFADFGHHLGNALQTVLFAVDPELIVFGGSIRRALPLFERSMRETLQSFAYDNSLKRLKIDVSEDDHIGLLGAAALAVHPGRGAKLAMNEQSIAGGMDGDGYEPTP